jgi:hypothetical protein
MSKQICHAHCPDEGGLAAVVVLAVIAAAVAAGLAVAAFVIEYAVVLAVGLAGVVVAAVALQVVLRRHMALCLPVRRAVAAPIQSPALTAARQRAAVMARPSRVLEGVVVDRIEVQR